MDKSRKKERIISLIALLLAGVLLRFFRLDLQSFWFDEAASVFFAGQPTWEAFFGVIRQDVHPPFYFVLLHYWLELFGDSDFITRSFSAVCATASLPLYYVLARSVLPRKQAYFALAIFALSGFQIWYAQEARAYALIVLMGIVLLILFFRFLSSPTYKTAIGHALIAALLLYTHYLASLFLLAEAICFLAWFLLLDSKCSRRSIKTAGLYIASLATCSLLFAPWLSTFMLQLHGVMANYWVATPGILDLFRLYLEFLCFQLDWHQSFGWFSCVIILLISAIVLLIAAKTGNSKLSDDTQPNIRDYPKLWLAILTILPPVLCWGLSQFVSSTFIPRVLILSSVPYYMLLTGLLFRIPKPPIRVGFQLLLLALCCVFYTRMWFNPIKENWRKAATYVQSMARTEDGFMFDAAGTDLPFRRYYRKPLPPVLGLEQKPSTHRIWMLRAMSKKPKQDIIGRFHEYGYELWHEKGVVGVDIMLFGKTS